MITRLMRIAVLRASVLEERAADEKDAALAALAGLREEVDDAIRRGVSDPHERERLAAAVADRFGDAQFPFGRDRHVPRITVRASAQGVSLEPQSRTPVQWSDEDKRALIGRGWALTDEALAAAGVDQPRNVAQSR